MFGQERWVLAPTRIVLFSKGLEGSELLAVERSDARSAKGSNGGFGRVDAAAFWVVGVCD